MVRERERRTRSAQCRASSYRSVAGKKSEWFRLGAERERTVSPNFPRGSWIDHLPPFVLAASSQAGLMPRLKR